MIILWCKQEWVLISFNVNNYCHLHIAGIAEKKGLRANDRLLEINGISVRDSSHQEAGRLIAGDGK